MAGKTPRIASALIVLLVVLWLTSNAHHGGLPFANSPWHHLSSCTLQMEAMGHICHDLRDYHYDHPNIRAEDMVGRTIADYVDMGILAPEDATYIRDHRIVFRGFDPSKIGGDIPVLEAWCTETSSPKWLVAYSDASATLFLADHHR